MKNTKRLITVMLAVIVIVGLVGCGGTQSTGGGEGVTTVTVWSGGSHSKTVYDRLINEYNQGQGKVDGISIDYQLKEGGTLIQNLEIALQSGTAPDLFDGGSLLKMAENDYIAAINDLPGGNELVKKYENWQIKNINFYNGKMYTVPTAATTQGLIYNKEMFKAAGLTDEKGEAKPPETFDELREYAKKLTNPDKREYGIIFPLKWGDGGVAWVNSDIISPMMGNVGHNGYDPVNDTYDYTGLAPIIDAFLGIKEDKSFFPGADGIDNDQARAFFADGKIGMKFGMSFDVGVLNVQFPASMEWGVAPYPLVDKNVKYKQRMDYGGSFYVTKKSLDTIGGEKLMKVFEFLTGDEILTALYIEGMQIPYNWSIVENVKIESPPTGWVEFCELANISARYPVAPFNDMSGQMSLPDRIMKYIWTGERDPISVLKEYNGVITEARDRYYAAHPDENPKEAVNPDWNIKLY